jgi:hypothetical protein
VLGDRQSLSAGPLQYNVRTTLSYYLEAKPSEPTHDLPCREDW